MVRLRSGCASARSSRSPGDIGSAARSNTAVAASGAVRPSSCDDICVTGMEGGEAESEAIAPDAFAFALSAAAARRRTSAVDEAVDMAPMRNNACCLGSAQSTID